jgi:hypothetical protein
MSRIISAAILIGSVAALPLAAEPPSAGSTAGTVPGASDTAGYSVYRYADSGGNYKTTARPEVPVAPQEQSNTPSGQQVNGSAVAAQSRARLGLIAGLSAFEYSATTQDVIGTVVSGSRTGMVFGALLDIAVSNVFSIEPALVYSMRGGCIGGSFPDYNYYYGNVTISYKSWLNFNYLAIPVHARLKYPGIPNMDPYFLAGLNLGILVSANSKERVTQTVEGYRYPLTDTTMEMDVTENYNAVDFGFDIGVGVEFNLGGAISFVEFVYDKGLVNIAKDAGAGNSLTNKGIEIKWGIRFKMGP